MKLRTASSTFSAAPGSTPRRNSGCRRHPGLRAIILTSFGGEQRVQRALEAGATGLLLKDGDVDEVAEAVRDVMRGRSISAPW